MSNLKSKSEIKTADHPPHKCDGPHVCGVCGTKKFDEPNSVGGVFVIVKKHFHRDRILLCLRANDPAKGDWTLPAGHGNLGEDTRATAGRELREEAGIDAEITGRKILEYTANIYPGEDKSGKPAKTEATHIYRLVLRGQASAALRSLQGFEKDETKEIRLFTMKEMSPLGLAFPFVWAARNAYKQTKHRKNFAAIEITTDDWWQGSGNEPADSRRNPSGRLSSIFKKPASRLRASARRQIASLHP